MQIKPKAGDTLAGLAAKYNTTVEQIVRDGKLQNPDLLRVADDKNAGDVLVIHPNSVAPKDPNLMAYPIQAHDTLRSIADHFLHDPDRAKDLIDLNVNQVGKDGNALVVGDNLLVPRH